MKKIRIYIITILIEKKIYVIYTILDIFFFFEQKKIYLEEYKKKIILNLI